MSTLSARIGATLDIKFTLPQEDGTEGGVLPATTIAHLIIRHPDDRVGGDYLTQALDIYGVVAEGEENAGLIVPASVTTGWMAGTYIAYVKITRPVGAVEVAPSALEPPFTFVIGHEA